MGIRFDVVYTTKELSRVLTEPTKTANEILDRALVYIKRTKNAYLQYSHDAMITYKPPPTRKKPTDITDTYDVSYNTTDSITHEDEKETKQEYIHPGPTMEIMVKTDCDLAGQQETRQTTTSLMVWVSGALVHWRAHTERIIIPSTAAGEYVALSKGNTTAKFIREVLKFYGNKHTNYYLLTDNQAAEHIATQPTMNEHSRSIDTRHHAIRQDYIDGEMRIGGVASQDNESDILTKYLQPPLHAKHTISLHLTHDKPAHFSPQKTTDTTIQNNGLHCTTRKTNFDPENHQFSPEFLDLILRGSTITPRQPRRERQCPSINPIQGSRSKRQHHLPPSKPSATKGHKSSKTTQNHPKTRHDRRGDKRKPTLRSRYPHPAHHPMCPTHTPMCPKHLHPARPYPTPDEHTPNPTLAPSQPALPSNFECFVQDGRRLRTKTCVEK